MIESDICDIQQLGRMPFGSRRRKIQQLEQEIRELRAQNGKLTEKLLVVTGMYTALNQLITNGDDDFIAILDAEEIHKKRKEPKEVKKAYG